MSRAWEIKAIARAGAWRHLEPIKHNSLACGHDYAEGATSCKLQQPKRKHFQSNTNDLGSTLMISHACCNGGDVTAEVTSDKGMPPMPYHNKTMTITLKATLLVKADEKRRVTKEREVKVLRNLLQFLATWKLLLKRRLW